MFEYRAQQIRRVCRGGEILQRRFHSGKRPYLAALAAPLREPAEPNPIRPFPQREFAVFPKKVTKPCLQAAALRKPPPKILIAGVTGANADIRFELLDRFPLLPLQFEQALDQLRLHFAGDVFAIRRGAPLPQAMTHHSPNNRRSVIAQQSFEQGLAFDRVVRRDKACEALIR